MRPRVLAVAGVVLCSLVAAVTGSVPAVAESAPLPQDSGLLSAGEASMLAAATGEPVVASEYTTERDLFTVVPGKGLVAEMSVDPVRVRQGEEWVDVDPSLRPGGDGRLIPAATVADLTISGDGAGSLVEITAPGGEHLALSWPEEYGDLPAPRVDGDLAVFGSVWPDIDLVVRSGVESFSTYLVVHTPQAAKRPEVSDFAFDLAVEGAEVRTGDEGRLEAVNGAGEVVLVSDLPRVWDAGQSAPGDGATEGEALRELVAQPVDARTADIGMDIDPADGAVARMFGDGQGDRLRLQTPPEFLEDPTLRYPIVLDPNVTVPDEAARWAMVWDSGDDWYGSPDSERARVGYDGWHDNASLRKISRMYYQFPIDQFDGVDLKITDATFLHKMVHSPEYACDTSGPPAVEVYRTGGYGAGISWGNQPERMGLQDESTVRSGNVKYCDARDQEWKVDAGLRNAKAQNWPRYTLMMKSASAHKDGWRGYRPPSFGYPKLIVTYNRAPSVTSYYAGNSTTDQNVWYDNAGWVRTRKPVLSVVSSDPDGDTVQGHFQVRNSSGTTIVDRKTARHESGGSPERITLTTSEITADGTYTWRAQGIDEHGFGGPWSSWKTLKIDTIRPPAPTIKAPRLASYGTGVTLTMDAQGEHSSDVRYYRYGFLTSATPSTKTPSSLGAAVSVTRTGHMGPDWITATASDVAGNTSTKAVAKFKVMGASTSHQWHLDGNGTDEAPTAQQPTTLALSGAPSWVSGHDRDYDPVGSGNQVWAASDKALSLNGAGQYATSSGANANLVKLPEGFSVSTWVKADPASFGKWSLVAAFPDPTDNWARARIGLSYDQWAFSLRVAGVGWVNVFSKELSSAQATGDWVHLTGVYEPSPGRIRLYVNGIEAGSAPVSAAVDQNENVLSPLLLGASPNGGSAPSGFFNGVVDEIRVYSGPLDPTGAYLVAHEVRNTP